MKHGICDILREKMMAYITPRDESVRWLSQRVELPYSSVYRIISREAHNCTFRNAYQILRIVAPEEAKGILIEYFPSFAPLIAQDRNFIENEDKLDRALELTLQTRMLYVLHSMASTSQGATRIEIKETYGRVGLDALDVLLEQEILIERRDGVIKDLLFETMQTNEAHLQQMIRYNLEGFYPADPQSFIFNCVEGYSEVGLGKYAVIVKEAALRIIELKNDSKNIGMHRIFVSLLAGKFDGQIVSLGGR